MTNLTKPAKQVRDVAFYVNRANERFEAGFTTMSGKKEAMGDLNYAYENKIVEW